MSLTTLAGTKWYFNETLTTSSNRDYEVEFDSGIGSHDFFCFYYSSQELYYDDRDSVLIYRAGTWTNQAYRTITFTGGYDITNEGFISWLESNATQIVDSIIGNPLIIGRPKGTVTITQTAFPINLIRNGGLRSNRIGWSFQPTATAYPYLETPTTNGFTIKVITSNSSRYPYIQLLNSVNQSQNPPQVYYCQAKVKGNSNNTSYPVVYLRCFVNGSTSTTNYYLTSIDGLSGTQLNDGEWHTISYYIATLEYLSDVATKENELESMAFAMYSASTVGDEGTIRDILLVNLTETYGSGNEPTKAWCDENITFTYTKGGIEENITYDDNVDIIYNNITRTASNLISNGSLAQNTTGWTIDSKYNKTQNDGYITLITNSTVSTSETSLVPCYQSFEEISGSNINTRQIYYCQAKIKGKSTNSSYPCLYTNNYANGSNTATYNYTTSIDGLSGTQLNDGEWHTLSRQAQTYNVQAVGYWTTNEIGFGLYPTNASNNEMSIKDIIIINLTAIFGGGNEPTKAWCDENIFMEDGIIKIISSPSKISINDEVHLNTEYGILNSYSSLFGTVYTAPNGVFSQGALSPVYTLLATAQYSVNTTSTTAASAGTIALGSSVFTSDKILYVKVRDKAGPRAGYFVGTDSYLFNFNKASSSTTTVTAKAILTHRRASGGAFTTYVSASGTVGYGVYPYSLDSSGNLIIYKRYNSTYTPTLNGTYVVEVYLLDYVGIAGNPFSYSAISW